MCGKHFLIQGFIGLASLTYGLSALPLQPNFGFMDDNLKPLLVGGDCENVGCVAVTCQDTGCAPFTAACAPINGVCYRHFDRGAVKCDTKAGHEGCSTNYPGGYCKGVMKGGTPNAEGNCGSGQTDCGTQLPDTCGASLHSTCTGEKKCTGTP